jgi:hypothetical protein
MLLTSIHADRPVSHMLILRTRLNGVFTLYTEHQHGKSSILCEDITIKGGCEILLGKIV